MNDFEKARVLLDEFKGDAYLYGAGVLDGVGQVVASQGDKAALVRGTFSGSDDYVRTIGASLTAAGVELAAEIKGARPNAPREDVYRITDELQAVAPDVIVSFGGGSTIDAAKAAEVLRTLGGGIDEYFGVGLVTRGCGEAWQGADAPRRHPDGGQLGRTPDQILQHHRRLHGPEETDRRRGHRARASRV